MIDPKEKIKLVELTKYNPNWPRIFTDAANEIKSILKENCIQIHHIGSTAIPNIYAKPIIDVLPVVKDISNVDSLNHEFEKLSYVCMGEYGIPGRRFYWKSKTKRTHNIHLHHLVKAPSAPQAKYFSSSFLSTKALHTIIGVPAFNSPSRTHLMTFSPDSPFKRISDKIKS